MENNLTGLDGSDLLPKLQSPALGTGKGEQRGIPEPAGGAWMGVGHPPTQPWGHVSPATLSPLQIHAASPGTRGCVQVLKSLPQLLGMQQLPWGAVGSGWTLRWGQLGYVGVCNSLSPDSSPQVLAVTGVSMQPPCPCCHTTRSSHRTLGLKYSAEFWLMGQSTPEQPQRIHKPTGFLQVSWGGHWPRC